jgi:isoaspartyl peptidase/L-asparaginase-like protein (Ntn-hydrolase superfamily)
LPGAGLWCNENIGVAATGIGEAITLKMSCVRIVDIRTREREGAGVAGVSGGTGVDSLQAALEWGVGQFDPSIEVGFIGLESEGSGFGFANTGMPWATKS